MYTPSMFLSPLEKQVLDLAIEDYTRLADVFNEVRRAMPGRTEDEYTCLAQSIVRKLLHVGYVILYYDDLTASTETHRAARQLTPSEQEVALSGRSYWIPEIQPAPGPGAFAIGATTAGEEAMYDAI